MIKILITILFIIQQFENKITILVNKKYMKDGTLLHIGNMLNKFHFEQINFVTFEKESLLVRNIHLVKQADLVIGVSDIFLKKFSDCMPIKIGTIDTNVPVMRYIKKTKNFIKHGKFVPIGFCDISLISYDKIKNLKNLDISIVNPLLSTTGMYILYFIENNMSRKTKNILLSKLSDTMFLAPNWAEAFFKFFNHQHKAVVTCFKDEFNTLNDYFKANSTIPIQNTYINKILNKKSLYIHNVFYERPLYIEYLFANSKYGLKVLLILLRPEFITKLQKLNYLEPAQKLRDIKNAAVMNSEEFWKKRKMYINNL